ncbi:hypothetical protein Aduo_009161 [Ancylostoma duodenale]
MRSFFAVILALIVAAVAVASANPLVYRAPQSGFFAVASSRFSRIRRDFAAADNFAEDIKMSSTLVDKNENKKKWIAALKLLMRETLMLTRTLSGYKVRLVFASDAFTASCVHAEETSSLAKKSRFNRREKIKSVR